MHISCDYKHLFWSTSILLASWPSVTSNSSTSNKHEDKAGNVFFLLVVLYKIPLSVEVKIWISKPNKTSKLPPCLERSG